MLPLSTLGERICIIGPSNSGKSTLAQNLGKHLGYPILHLDQIAHLPNTNWQPRNHEEFRADHDTFIQNNTTWIIEGGYGKTMPYRFENSTYIIWIDIPSFFGFLKRYIYRSFKNNPNRPGALTGVKRDFNFGLIHYVFKKYPAKRREYQKLVKDSHKPVLFITSIKHLNEYYDYWNTPKEI